MLQADFRHLVRSEEYLKDSNIIERCFKDSNIIERWKAHLATTPATWGAAIDVPLPHV